MNSDGRIRSRFKISLSRVAICILALVLLYLLTVYSGEIIRRVRFLQARNLTYNGLTFFLNPQDKMITEHMLDTGTYEPETTAVICELLEPGDTFIDVGANIGWFTVLASRQVGDEGRVIAFEPDPESFQFLRQNVEINQCQNVILEQKALSNERGLLQLHLHDSNLGGHSFFNSNERSTAVDVEALPLDEYLKSSDDKVDLIKIDTEGAEGLIIAGMTNTIRSQAEMDIIMEFTPGVLRENGSDPKDLLVGLLDSNYELFVIDHPSGDLIPVEIDRVSNLVQLLEREQKHANILLRRKPKN